MRAGVVIRSNRVFDLPHNKSTCYMFFSLLKIKVSIENKGGCSRRYKNNAVASTSNTLKFHFKTPKPQENMLLFLLNSKRQVGLYLLLDSDRTSRIGGAVMQVRSGAVKSHVISKPDKKRSHIWFLHCTSEIENCDRNMLSIYAMYRKWLLIYPILLLRHYFITNIQAWSDNPLHCF